jgi:predicted AlkP superfamily phosphohydrolase/phosphomutase
MSDTLMHGRSRLPPRLLPLFLLVALLVATASCRGAHGGRPVIVLAFDGLDYDLTRRLIDAGRMPHFAQLAHSGGFMALPSTMPPQSPVAWSSFVTGLSPVDHGIFDFVHRDPATMTPYLSTTETEPPSWVVNLGKWSFPLRGGHVKSLVDGTPFWARLDERGVETTIVRMPANYPPSGRAARELSGMGTPDLLGTYGTFVIFSSAPTVATDSNVEGGRLRRVEVVDETVRAALEGPPNPLRSDSQILTTPMTAFLDRTAGAARVAIGDEERVLKAGEWSDWIPVSFHMAPLQTLNGMCRIFLRQVQPDFELYVSPINIDPASPALIVSSPSAFARELADATGRFYTQGMPEDTKAYTAGVFDTGEFLHQASITAAENRRQFRYLLDRFRGGLFFHYFGHVDQVSHVMWRTLDPGHPAYVASRDAKYGGVIEDLYAGLDQIVGQALSKMPAGTLLIVMSDHGFTSWRRSFNLNRWLEEAGYLVLKNPSQRGEGLLQDIDWTRTRAYALGLNGLYLNVKGRERFGIVAASDRDALAKEIQTALLEVIDPQLGTRAITAVFRPQAGDHPLRHPDRTPDLIVGYAKGTRTSNFSALGGVPRVVMEDNVDLWSGDHCMDPAAVPGVLLSSRPLRSKVTSLQDVSKAILAEYD